MKPTDLERLMKAIAAPIREALFVRDASIKALTSRLEALEAKLSAIEEKGVPTYQGLFDSQVAYAKGSCVTFDGSLWIAREVTHAGQQPPGNNWQLAVKRGRDYRPPKDRR